MSAVKNEDGTFTVSLAVYSSKYGSLIAFPYPSSFDGDYVQLSEPLNVIFKPLPDSVVIDKQVEALNAQKAKLRAEFEMSMSKIDCKLSELLCITSEVEK